MSLSDTFDVPIYENIDTFVQINRKSQNLLEADNKSQINYVLVYHNKPGAEKKLSASKRRVLKSLDKYTALFSRVRKIYQNKLKREGLILEEYPQKNDKNVPEKVFVKVHAPDNVLKYYAQKLKLRMPVKKEIDQELKEKRTKKKTDDSDEIDSSSKTSTVKSRFAGICALWSQQDDYILTAEYSQNKGNLFEDDKDDFFSTSDRCMIVNFILEQVKFIDNEKNIQHAGLTKLIDLGVYDTAYPPHEGILGKNKDNKNKKWLSEREYLLQYWASAKIFSYQPVDAIKNYFGMKFALYFVWLDFYTYMLIPPALLGLIPVFYGVLTSGLDILSKEICVEDKNSYMCPRPGQDCTFEKISDGCLYYKIRYVFDNYSTYVFAFLMSVWSALYLEFWKRHSAAIKHRWGLSGFSLVEEQPRPNYEYYTAKNEEIKEPPGENKAESKLNIQMEDEESELNVPFWSKKLPWIVFSYTLVILGILFVLLFLFGTVLYSIFYPPSNQFEELFFVPVIMAILINIFNALYSRVAEWVTEFEYQRTQVEFDNSLQLKTYLFHFTTNYIPLFYTAFIKGRFVGVPNKYITVFGMRQEECDLGGCMFEVCIQLAIFMVCEQLINNFFEYIWPHIQSFCSKKDSSVCERFRDLFGGICGMRTEGNEPRWREDINLNPWDTQILSEEYLEMVVQYGFITIFVTSFPLAPLLALLNNIFIEKSLDANKFIRSFRRPVAQRVPDVGIWFEIMKSISNISILTNACIIAFSTNLIPKILYAVKDFGDGEPPKDFMDYSFSIYNVSNLVCHNNDRSNPSVCVYNEIKRDANQKRTFVYWHVLVARLLFVVFYLLVVTQIVTVIDWFIPDVPEKLNVAIKKEENYVSEKLLVEYNYKKDIPEDLNDQNETELRNAKDNTTRKTESNKRGSIFNIFSRRHTKV